MQGIGNDYIFVNEKDAPFLNKKEFARKASDRHFGIGGDGVVFYSAENGKYAMRIFNSDGSEAGICGNALRCLGKLLYEKGFTKEKTFEINTRSGGRRVWVDVKNGVVDRIAVNMEKPSFFSPDIPSTGIGKPFLNEKVSVDGKVFSLNAVSVGNPHCVIFKKISSQDFFKYGRYFSSSSLFPSGANVEFVEISEKNVLEIRVYERGSGETMACGSGATAAFAVAFKLGLVEKTAYAVMAGGELKLSMEEGGRIIMSGKAGYCFEGSL